ncbi:MAG: hypothetical protein CMM02_19750 [Rhodopirellula sp.]|nr:hypothetical protein [Rhodopirellula sp.]|tara:strand:- start:46 stop:435 length:390 start_codon:yes stop_codon:yes gene_type:complete
MFQALIGPIASIAGSWIEGRVAKTKANAKKEVAMAEAEATVMQKKATGEIDWDLEMAKGSQASWKDEWITVLFSIPLILSFCGDWGRTIVFEGFQALKEMPEWYQYSLGLIVAASFGMRGATKFFGRKK